MYRRRLDRGVVDGPCKLCLTKREREREREREHHRIEMVYMNAADTVAWLKAVTLIRRISENKEGTGNGT